MADHRCLVEGCCIGGGRPCPHGVAKSKTNRILHQGGINDELIDRIRQTVNGRLIGTTCCVV